MQTFFDTDGDLWLPVAGERPDNVPPDMLQLLTLVRTDATPSGAAEQPTMYVNLTRYVRMVAMSTGCPT